MLDSNLGVEPGLFGDNEEGADRSPGGRAGGEPFVDVGLGAARGGALVGLVEPGQELDGLGDLLLGRVHRSPGGSGGLGADSAEVVPAGEVLDRLADLVGEAIELGVDPLHRPVVETLRIEFARIRP